MISNRSFVLSVLVLLALSLATSAAIADQTCRKVNSNVTALGEFLVDDPQCGDYDFCQSADLKGTLNGTWWVFGNDGDEVVIADGTVLAFWLDAVIETKHGDLYLVDREIANLLAADGLAFHDAVAETGSTGRYEGATGWFAGYLTFAPVGGKLAGEICWNGD